MRIIETKAYQFSELSEEAKQKAIESHYDINVDYDWWDFIYDDAENVGIEITGFDLDRRMHCEGDFICTAKEVAQKILEEHGDQCGTYKTAAAFMEELENLKNLELGRYEQYCDETPEDERPYDDFDEWLSCHDDDIETAKDEFKKSILEDYSIMLQEEYEYLTSEEAIIETIEANEYEFTENGKRI